jgi:DUF917 family protein
MQCCVLTSYPYARHMQVLVPHTLSLAWRLGHAVAVAQHKKLDPGSEIAAETGGRVLFRGATSKL